MKFYIFQNLVFAEFDDVKRKAAEREKRVIGMVIPIKTSTPRSERRSSSKLFLRTEGEGRSSGRTKIGLSAV